MDRKDVNCKVISDNVPKKWRKAVDRMKEIVNHSPQEIYAMLVECKMDSNVATDRLLDQGEFQEVKRKGNKKKQDRELMNGDAGDHDDETSNEQIIDNHLAGSSTTTGTLGPNPPLNTEVITGFGSETSSKQITNNHLAGPSTTTVICHGPNPPSNRDLTKVKAVPSLRPVTSSFSYASVLKKNLVSSKESVNQPPVNDDCPLDETPDTILCDEDNNRNNETQLQTDSFEQNLTKDPSASVVTSLQKLSIETDDSVEEDKPVPNELHVNNNSEMNGSDSTEFWSPKDPSDYGLCEEEEQGIKMNVGNEHQINSNETHEPNQENPVVAPSDPSIQMQNHSTFHESTYLDPPFYPSLPTNQINPKSSIGRMPSASVNHHYSQPNVSYGNTMNYPHSQQAQIGGDNYNINQNPSLYSPSGFQQNFMLPSGSQQNCGRNNNIIYPDQSLASAMVPQYRNNVPSAYGCANLFGMSNNNAANPSFGYDSFLNSQLNSGMNQFPPIQHQISLMNGHSNVRPPHQESNNSRVNSRNEYSTARSTNQFQRPDNSGFLPVFLGRSSTGTGVFMRPRFDHNSPETAEAREKDEKGNSATQQQQPPQ